MILEGLKLMLAGMFVVYIFLSALLIMIKVSAYFFGSVSPSASGSVQTSVPKDEGGRIAAVIAAALSAYGTGKK
ncbi:MAG: hypothetical protein GKS04_00435 [Candidatus Mycalebacterium zealandia]|nr:MAG: hypothetical protein GKS04_00435 [Candidatus Mycalebacterium zealandia]